MAETPSWVKLPSLRNPDQFKERLAQLQLDLPCDSTLETGPTAPLGQPIVRTATAEKTIGNRWAVHPMEGWDASPSGQPTAEVIRRWQRFGESGAKLIWGGEAMAVLPEGRANPNQLILSEGNEVALKALRQQLVDRHREIFGRVDDLVIGFQLTHSGRFCRPNHHGTFEPRVAFRHPLLDQRFGVVEDRQVLTDAEIPRLTQAFVDAARVAQRCGADFVDIKHCHGYLLHEFLAAHRRPGPYGGSFENRTRLLREIVQGIRSDGNQIELGVRLSAFDFLPFRPDASRAKLGKLGPGIPVSLPQPGRYEFGFGVNPDTPTEWDLTEPIRFLKLCRQLGIRLISLSAGSPYYNPHIQRPASYPPSDGYEPPEDPLIGVQRQVEAVRQLRRALDATDPAVPPTIFVGSGYSYLQEFLPFVAQAAVREGWVDIVGLGRMVLSYPNLPADVAGGQALQSKRICRTFSDCTSAPRNGMISGCYPLDPYYAAKPEAARLKQLKRALGR